MCECGLSLFESAQLLLLISQHTHLLQLGTGNIHQMIRKQLFGVHINDKYSVSDLSNCLLVSLCLTLCLSCLIHTGLSATDLLIHKTSKINKVTVCNFNFAIVLIRSFYRNWTWRYSYPSWCCVLSAHLLRVAKKI